MDPASLPPASAGLFRRFASQVYDFMLVVALWFIATFAVLPLTGGEAITPATQGGLAWLYRGWLLAIAFGYFGLCWVRSGQTLGLRAWGSRLQPADGGAVSWRGAALRFAGGTSAIVLAIAGAWQLARPGWTPSDLLPGLMLLP